MRAGPAGESPSRLQQAILGSHSLSSVAVGVVVAGVPAVLALATRGPRAAQLMFPCVGAVAGLGYFLFSSARHSTKHERLETVVVYPSWSIPRATSDRQRTGLAIVLVGLSMFAVGRVVTLITGSTSQADWTALVVDLAVAALVALMLRRPRDSDHESRAEAAG
jgi:hypothetical protein